MILSSFTVVFSLILLFYGAEFSLDASEKIGKRMGLSPLVVGMVLVGFGTSLPEFFVGHIAAIRGETEMAVGALVGSNIANMFLILGICGFMTALPLNSRSVKEQVGIHLILCLVLAIVLRFQKIGFISSLALLSVTGIYMYFVYLDMDRNFNEHKDETYKIGNPAKVLIKLLGGFVLLYLGGELAVKGGTELCLAIGIPQYVISAIFIAFGTSFPELVTSVTAAVKKKDTDLIVGNILGSNLFNCSLILGTLGIYDIELPGKLAIECYALIGGAILMMILAILNRSIFRATSFIYISIYGIMIAYWLK